MIFRLKTYLSQARDAVSQQTHADRFVMEAFDSFFYDLFRTRQDSHAVTEEEIFRIIDATAFASGKHQSQNRRNLKQTPYIVHPLRVANYLLFIGHIYDADILIAALLHDTVEDTPTTHDEIRKYFGYRVQHLVQELTDDKGLLKAERKHLQIKNAAAKSAGAAQVILADKLSNLIDLLKDPPVGWEDNRITDYFLWAQQVIKFLPHANLDLLNAVELAIDTYWQRLAEKEYGK